MRKSVFDSQTNYVKMIAIAALALDKVSVNILSSYGFSSLEIDNIKNRASRALVGQVTPKDIVNPSLELQNAVKDVFPKPKKTAWGLL